MSAIERLLQILAVLALVNAVADLVLGDLAFSTASIALSGVLVLFAIEVRR
jgi:hypothetical protein